MRVLVCLIFVLSFISVFGQFDPNYRKNNPQTVDEATPPINLGLGMGLNYGGFGGRLELVPQKNIAIFGAVGFNLHKAGFNIGAKVKVAAEKKVSPMFQFMYGYNAVILVVGASEYNKTYYGPSVGGGIELKMGQSQNFMEFGLLIPFRNEEFRNDITELQYIGIDISEPLPFAISVGYHFKI
jgi:hypothetical protein